MLFSESVGGWKHLAFKLKLKPNWERGNISQQIVILNLQAKDSKTAGGYVSATDATVKCYDVRTA